MLALFALLAAPAFAEVVPVSAGATAPPLDGPWVQVPDDMTDEELAAFAAPPSHADIVAMADLDGDPTVVTADEEAMIRMLGQLLGTPPITQ